MSKTLKILKIKKISSNLLFIPKVIMMIALFMTLAAPGCSHRAVEKIKQLDELEVPEDWGKTIPNK